MAAANALPAPMILQRRPRRPAGSRPIGPGDNAQAAAGGGYRPRRLRTEIGQDRTLRRFRLGSDDPPECLDSPWRYDTLSTMKRKISLLDYALLCLLRQEARSGYDLRKVFAATPLGSFSDSPGAIYPALRRLERGGLIRGRIEEGAGLRRRQIFTPTAAGRAALQEWLARAPTRLDVARHMDEVMLRFAFSEEFAGRAASIRILRSLLKELRAYIPFLLQFLNQHRPEMSLSGSLALERGIRDYQESKRWAEHALRRYEDRNDKGTSP